MRKRILIIAVAMLSILSGCTKELQLDVEALKNRISTLEAAVERINKELTSTQQLLTAFEDNDFIVSVRERSSGNVKSYVITFSSGRTITLADGESGESPIVGIRQFSDGNYYWTVQQGSGTVQWMTTSLGMKIKATAVVPQLKVEDDYWHVSYDSGLTWTKLSLRATGTEGEALFSGVTMGGDFFVQFKMADGTSFFLPTLTGFKNLTDFCGRINGQLSAFADLFDASKGGIDSTLMVNSIERVLDNGTLSGYIFHMNNGQNYTLPYKMDDAPVYSLGIADDAEGTWWTIQYPGNDPQWLYNDAGARISVKGESGTPQVSVKAEGDKYYFVYRYSETEEYKYLLNANGEKVEATTAIQGDILNSVEIGDDEVVMEFSNGTRYVLPIAKKGVPKIFLAKIEDNIIVTSEGTYQFAFRVENPTADTKVEALGLEGAKVTNIAIDTLRLRVEPLPGEETDPEGGKGSEDVIVANEVEQSPVASGVDTLAGVVTFTTPVEMTKCRIMVILSWNNGSNMTVKQIEFEYQPRPEPVEPDPDPENPDPENPDPENPDPENPVDPEEPVDPDPVEPENPVDPDPVEP